MRLRSMRGAKPAANAVARRGALHRSINGPKIPTETRTVIGVARALKSRRARSALCGDHVVFGLAGEPHVPKRR